MTLAGGLPGGLGVYDIVANPDVGGAVIAANDAGVFETMDGGTTWTEVFDEATRSLAYSDAFAGVPGEPFVEQLIAAVTWDDRVFLGRRVNGTWDWTDETGDLAPAVPMAVAYSRTDQSWYVATEASGTYRTGLDVTVGVPQTGIGDSGPALYASPNPFLAQTTVSFETTEAGLVRVDVYDVHGRHVASLMDRVLPPGDTARRGKTWTFRPAFTPCACRRSKGSPRSASCACRSRQRRGGPTRSSGGCAACARPPMAAIRHEPSPFTRIASSARFTVGHTCRGARSTSVPIGGACAGGATRKGRCSSLGTSAVRPGCPTASQAGWPASTATAFEPASIVTMPGAG